MTTRPPPTGSSSVMSRTRTHAHHVVQDDGRPYISTFSGFNVSFMRLNSVREGEGIGGGPGLDPPCSEEALSINKTNVSVV